ncbi:MAG: hypothetical protein ACK5P0_01275 [bacterium]|jgi:hypothetical protein
MYAILVKDSGNTYDVIAALRSDGELRERLDSEWEKNLPIIGIDLNNHKSTATMGATWNGTSFDGTAKPDFFELSQEQKDAYRQYGFLCDNKIIHRISVNSDSEKAALYDAAFSGEVLLVKCVFAVNGTKVVYDHATREISAA